MNRRAFWHLLSAALLFASTVLAGAGSGDWGPDVYRPDSLTICLLTGQGDTVVFRDGENVDFEGDFARYGIASRLEDQDYWVIHRIGYEWETWYLVNGSTGEIDTTISPPVVSPDGTRLLCFMDDIMAGFVENGVQIWRTGSDGLVMEFQDLSVPWGPVEAEWKDDSTVAFLKMYFDWDIGDYYYETGRLELNEYGEWIPDDPESWSFPD
jgi:hypothetical protein